MPIIIITRPGDTWKPVKSEAVDSHERAWQAAHMAVCLAYTAMCPYVHGTTWPTREEIAQLPESGGTIGPLPDGTIIEVVA